MHNYTHEFKRATRKTPEGNVHIDVYLGSRCSTDGCSDNRRPTLLPLVKALTEQTGKRPFPAHSRTVSQR